MLDAEGKPLSVRAALTLVNRTLDEALAEREGDFDADSRWALTWFEHAGFAEGDYSVAEQLSKSKNTTVAGLIGSTVTVSIEVEAVIPDGAPDHVVRSVTENSQTLEFTSHGFEKEQCLCQPRSWQVPKPPRDAGTPSPAYWGCPSRPAVLSGGRRLTYHWHRGRQAFVRDGPDRGTIRAVKRSGIALGQHVILLRAG